MRAFTDSVTLSHHFISVELDRAKRHAQAKKRQKGEKTARLRLGKDERMRPQRGRGKKRGRSVK